MKNHTIVSLATPFGYSSIAVIRLSGSLSFFIALKLSRYKKKPKHLLTKVLSVFSDSGKKIDKCVFTFFKGPVSYTGEDVVEISCHGNPTIAQMIINRSVDLGASLAEPGEYTKRAFLNGKMSLSQAESVALLISSRSKKAVYSNSRNIEGASAKKIKEIKNDLLSALSILEYELDVSEDDHLTKQSILKSDKTLKNNCLELSSLCDSYALGSAYNNGFRVVIVGQPNVGKSTLMNALLGLNRSITSKTPGTTRDTITQSIVLGGCPITLVDTAGFRKSKDLVEQEGVRRGELETEKADLVLSVFCQGTEPIENNELRKQIMVYNKIDKHKEKLKKGDVVLVSALKNKGIKKLLSKIQLSLFKPSEHTGDLLINTERQLQAIKTSLGHNQKAIKLLKQKTVLIELVSHETRKAIDSLDVFLGKSTTDDILDQVFSNFCVGK